MNRKYFSSWNERKAAIKLDFFCNLLKNLNTLYLETCDSILSTLLYIFCSTGGSFLVLFFSTQLLSLSEKCDEK